MNTVFDVITTIGQVVPGELAEIWLTNRLKFADRTGYRIAPGDLVKIENMELKDCTGKPSHIVTGCYGGLLNDFQLTAIDLKTKELIKIHL